MTTPKSTGARPHTHAPELRDRDSNDPVPGELALRGVMLALAVGSTAFAASMIGAGDQEPYFAGIEHLRIFAQPTTVLAQKQKKENLALAAASRNGVDYTPVGAVEAAPAPLAGYEVVRADVGSAVIRNPRGAAVRVLKGDVLADAGKIVGIVRQDKHWVVVTSRGYITEKPAAEQPAAQ